VLEGLWQTSEGEEIMRSLKQQILILLLAALVVLATSFIFVFSWHMKERAISAAIIKAKSDLATCAEIVDLTFPGDWRVIDGILYKGEKRLTHENDIVDRLSELTGDTVTIFLNDTRVATTVRGTNGERALGTKVSDIVAEKVLKNGEIYLGEANVVGQTYQTAYEPFRDAQGNIIGMLYVGISRSYAQEMIVNSIWKTAVLGVGLTLIVGLLTWIFVDKVWIRPLRNITLGTRDLATGHTTEKIKVSGPSEIGELATAFNQMIERLETVAKDFAHRTQSLDSEEVEESPSLFKEGLTTEASSKDDLIHSHEELATHSTVMNYVNYEKSTLEMGQCSEEKDLPKGLNKETLRQIIGFILDLDKPASSEEVAEGVKLTRVTVRRYLEYLEQCGSLTSELKYGAVGRPVRLWSISRGL
jgi:methyl-accepting chemotaxis protein